ncbi:MAG: DUF1624 domain-containing protein [Burkholderiales bacterium]|nr:DUF1624 domain-containing protein [Burkholderiales bacterium]
MNPPSPRFDRLDAARAVAMIWMACFHFGFDLANFGFTQQDFYHDPVWTRQRICIVSLFLLCAGIGQAVALDAGQPWRRFWRRWLQIAGAAVLVSIGSSLMFPRSWISFGILHGIALMLIATRLAAPLRGWLWPLGAAAIALPQLVQSAFFDTRWTNWVGLVTHKPVTEDYAPIFPWLGVMLWGLAAGQWLLAHRRGWLEGMVPRGMAPFARLGRWSLAFYLVHQPVLIGVLLAWRATMAR